MSKFLETETWRTNWTIVRNIGGGGQADSFEVADKETGTRAFLKVLRNQGSEERRSRFYREAVAYDTLSHDGLPTLIETNAQNHADTGYQLYLVTELISGPSLSESTFAPICFDEALTFALPFLDILAYLHGNGTVHRDIKPDNVILRDGRLDRPVLVDLGLAYREIEDGLDTQIEEEIGNRFLRLPELTAGSLAKQDPASDVTFAAGLLFFLFTSEYPYALLDEAGLLPHQRATARQMLDRTAPLGRRILSLFDRTFAYRSSDRIRSGADLALMLRAISRGSNEEPSFDAQIGAFEAELNTPELQTKSKLEDRLDIVMNAASHASHAVGARLKARYLTSQTSYQRSAGMRRNHLGLVDRDDASRTFYNTVTAELIGDEINVILDGQEFARLEAEGFDVGQLQKQFEDQFMLSAMRFHQS